MIANGGGASGSPQAGAHGSTIARSTLRPALRLMSGRVVGFAASFLIPIALVRIFDQHDFGTYKQLFLIAATLYGIGQLGMAESLYYFLPRSPEAGARHVANTALALVAGGVASLVALLLGGSAVARWLGNPGLAGYDALLGLYVCLTVASASLEIVMVARKRYRLASWTYAALDLMRAALLVGPALLFPDLTWLLWGAVGFGVVRCALAVWYLNREFEGALVPDRALFRTQLAYAMPFALSGIVEIVQASFHQYYVAYRFDAASFAVYAVGCLQIPLVEVATASMLNVMMVRMSEELRDDRPLAAVAVWHDSARKLSMMFFPLLVLLLVTAHPLIAFLFTERYAASTAVFAVSCLSLLLPALAVDAVLRVQADTRVLFGLNVTRLIVTIALIGPLVSRLGLPGAMLATVIAGAVTRALGLVRIGRLLGLSPAGLLPWRALATTLAAAALAGVPAAGALALAELPPLVALLVAGAIYAPAYVLALSVLGAVTPGERRTVTTWLARRGLVPAWAHSTER